MNRLRHAFVGLLAGIGLIAGGGSSDLLEPSLAQATQDGTILMAAQTPMVYDFTLNDFDGRPVSLSQFRGKVLLLVNTASFCGNTPTSKSCVNDIGRKASRYWHSPRTTLGSRSLERMQKSKHSVTPNTAYRFRFSARSA
mgnify:CR=1 FL=1|jgi:hypothetical protein